MFEEEEIVRRLRRSLCEVLTYASADEVAAGQTMGEFGASSIDRAEVIIRSLESLGLDLPYEEFWPVDRFDCLARAIHERQATR